MRNTYVEVNLENLKQNIKNIINNYSEYKYRIAVVKADFYGHGINCLSSIIEGGANYLAVSSLEEALEIRKCNNDIPILILIPIDLKYIDLCIDNNISITLCSLKQVKEIIDKNVNVHLRINGGNDDLNSFSKRSELNETVNLINNSDLKLEGIYTHIFCALSKEEYNLEISKFIEITKDIDLSSIPMIHIPNSEALVLYDKLKFVNGFRMGAIMYGINNKDYLSTFQLKSKVISVRTLDNESIGYDKCYTANNLEKVGIISIGYGDGFSKSNKGSYVYINDKKYLILGVFMDLTIIKIDESVKENDIVYMIRDNNHLTDISNHLNTVYEEVTCTINKRVPRNYR